MAKVLHAKTSRRAAVAGWRFCAAMLTVGALTACAGFSRVAAPIPDLEGAKKWIVDATRYEVATVGHGWDSSGASKAQTTCIVSEYAESDPKDGQIKEMKFTEVKSTYALQRSLGMDASAQYQGVTQRGKGKASFTSEIDVNSSTVQVSVDGYVHASVSFVAHPPVSHEKAIEQAIDDSYNGDENKSLAEISAELNLNPKEAARDARAGGLSFPGLDPRDGADTQAPVAQLSNNGPDLQGLTRLTQRFAAMAKEDPKTFRKICGDTYIDAIAKGGQLAAVYSFDTQSNETKREIRAAMKGSGWGVTARGSLESTVDALARQSKLTLNWFQIGGGPSKFPSDPAGFYDAISNFPIEVSKAPSPIKLQIARYDQLPNWPTDAKTQTYFDAMDEVAFHFSKWNDLSKTTQTIIGQTAQAPRRQRYLLGRGVHLTEIQDLNATADERLSLIQDRLSKCEEATEADGVDPCRPDRVLERLRPTGDEHPDPTADDLPLRAKLPTPIVGNAALQAERFLRADLVESRIVQDWVRSVNSSRCGLSTDKAMCKNEAYLRDKVRPAVAVDENPRVMLVSVLDEERNCALVNNDTGAVNYSNPCNLSDGNVLFDYDVSPGRLRHVNSGKCLTVAGGSNDNNTRILVKPCGQAGGAWTRTKGGRGGWLIKAKHSGKCLSVSDDGLRTQLQQRDCRKSGGKEVGWQKQNWLLVNN